MNKVLSLIKNNKKIVLSVIGFVLLLFVPPIFKSFSGGIYYLNVINYIFVYAVATMGLNIMTGYTGQINLGGAAYFSVGAYSVVILKNMGLPLIICIIAGMAIVALFGFLTAIPAARLKYHFLALATMAVGDIVNNLLTVSPGGITNDTHGMFVKAFSIFGYKMSNDFYIYYFLLPLTVLCFVFSWAFVNSRTGRACIATRDSVDASSSCGINVKKYKIIATVVSCVMIGFGGFLFAYVNRYISPDTFAAGKSTMFMSMMMLGGSGTLIGPILGTILVTLIMELLRAIPGASIYMQISYGIVLLLVIMFMPEGIVGMIKDFRMRKKVGDSDVED